MKKSIIYGFSALFALLSANSFAETAKQDSQQFQQIEKVQPQTKQTQTKQTEAKQATKKAPAQQVATTPQANLNTVNLNTATAAELQDKLLGIGAKKAQAIVEYREKNGAFMSAEQLSEVSGIGAKTVEKNRDRIVIQ